MTTTGWRNLMGRVLLVLGLVAGPWPSALIAAPVPAHCPCCDDGAPCTPDQCAASVSAPGLPVRTATLLVNTDGADLQAALSTRPPEPRPGERLRPPIA